MMVRAVTANGCAAPASPQVVAGLAASVPSSLRGRSLAASLRFALAAAWIAARWRSLGNEAHFDPHEMGTSGIDAALARWAAEH
jgi:hypothetical protein